MKNKNIKTLLLDNGHGENTPGKCSPDRSLYEWRYNRDIVDKIIELAPENLKVVKIVEELEDITLSERCQRVNTYIKEHPLESCVLISIHGNAAGNGKWMTARGWEIFTTKGQNNSDILAECIATEVKENFLTKIRTDESDGDLDKEEQFYILRNSNCPCCLSENFFYDNLEDLELMLNESVRYSIAQMHISGVLKYFEL